MSIFDKVHECKELNVKIKLKFEQWEKWSELY